MYSILKGKMMIKKCENQCVTTIEASVEALKAFRICQDEDSDGGEKITTEEFTEHIFPAIRNIMKEAWMLYVSSLEEHSKEAEVLMHRCISCSSFHSKACSLYNDMDKENVTWADFQYFVTKTNTLCLEGADNAFYIPGDDGSDKYIFGVK